MKQLWLLSILIFGIAPSARAVILDLRDGVRVTGYLVDEDGTSYTVRRVLDGRESVQTFARSDVLFALPAFDPRRLSGLSPEKPAEYRLYAEELSEKREDPEARALAIRLFLIAASLDPEGLGRGCLLSMASLARSPDEERRYRAMAYQLDPRHDRSVLAPPSEAARRGARARHDFAQAMAFYRAGQTSRALSYARRPGVAELFSSAVGIPSFSEFEKSCEDHPECSKCGPDGLVRCPACKGSGSVGTDRFRRSACPDCLGSGEVVCPDCDGKKSDLAISDGLRRALLLAEISALASASPDSGGSFARSLLRDPNPAPLLSVETLTQFNPRECVYRNGRWVEPPADER